MITLTDQIDAAARYTDTGTVRLTSYGYRMQAITYLTTSAESAVAAVTTPLAVPAMPIALTGSAGSPYSITISWQAGNTAGGAVAGYIPSISSDEGQTFTPYSTTPLSPSITTATFNELTPQSVYLFEVVAENAAGNSDYAGPAGARTTAFVPAPPDGLSAAATANAVALSWTDHDATDELDEEVWRKDPQSASLYLLATVAAGTTSYTDLHWMAAANRFCSIALNRFDNCLFS